MKRIDLSSTIKNGEELVPIDESNTTSEFQPFDALVTHSTVYVVINTVCRFYLIFGGGGATATKILALSQERTVWCVFCVYPANDGNVPWVPAVILTFALKIFSRRIFHFHPPT